MGFSSLDDFISEITANGKFYRSDWNKNVLPTTAQTAGLWYDLACGAGNPGSDTDYGSGGGGTNLAFRSLLDTSTTSPGIQHGGNVTPDTKHIINASAFSAAATTMPAVLMLIDRLGFYPITTTTTTGDQALNNTVVFPTGRDCGEAHTLCPSSGNHRSRQGEHHLLRHRRGKIRSIPATRRRGFRYSVCSAVQPVRVLPVRKPQPRHLSPAPHPPTDHHRGSQ